MPQHQPPTRRVQRAGSGPIRWVTLVGGPLGYAAVAFASCLVEVPSGPVCVIAPGPSSCRARDRFLDLGGLHQL